MRLACIFTDKIEMNEHRKMYGSDHLNYLKENNKEILIGGGFRDEVDGQFVGGMWILEVASFERATELIENDPYFVPELRSYKLKLWGKACDEPVVL
ncbi:MULTISPECIES: YciI family protein [Reinekea]|uniref:YCII-related domain-containing protein n=1 Tax=Reinekea forsetii TaxID=1336806 RepID=A0A2K8KPT1_9GAMM|nr:MULTISPECIES: YciI family protein [Reinekea]ATX75871.1 hypothetical protein REIFOR_00703 [Reinekea forsetii]MDO7645873.1 YciI family protein [Reinekea forsetii]